MNPIFNRSHETTKLVELFRGMSLETQMSFQDASRRVGFTVNSSSGAYHSARRIAAKEHQIIIEGVRKFGFMRLAGHGMVGRLDRHLGTLRRCSRRGAMEAEIAIGQNLTQEDMLAASDKLVRMRIIADNASAPKTNRVRQEEPEKETPVDVRANLRAIGGKG